MKWTKEYWDSSGPEKTFVIDFTNLVFSDRLPVVIALDVVRNIATEYPRPYNLFVSGGVDSQSMLWAWHNTNINFKAFFVRYKTNDHYYNDHDYQTLLEFSKKYNIKIEFLDFDVINFLESDLLSYAIKYQCTSPQICTYMKMSELVKGGTIIFSGSYLDSTVSSLDYTIYGTERYGFISNRNVISRFLLHEKELAGSFLILYKKYCHLSIDPYELKCLVYHRSGFPVIPQKEKYTGFEYIKKYYDSQQNLVSIDEIEEAKNKPSQRVFDIVFRYRLEKLVKYNNDIKFIFPE